MNHNIEFIRGLHPPQSIFYVGAFTKAGPVSGGFYNDPVKACQDAMDLDQHPNIVAVYVSSQPVKQCPPGQALNTQVSGCKPPKNDDIARLSNYFIDIDPVRESGTIATDQQVELVRKVGSQLQHDLFSSGFPEMMVQFSGNGLQLFGKIDLVASQDNVELLKGATATIARHYGTDGVKFDLAIYNPARLCRFPGTTNRKGQETEILRHRQAEVLHLPSKQVIIDPVWMQQLAGQSSPTPVEKFVIENFSADGILKKDYFPRFNLEAYLSFYGVSVVKIVKHGDVTLYVLAQCPNNPNHGYGKAAIGIKDDGTLIFFCFHDSCRSYKWQDVRNTISSNDSLDQFWDNGKQGYDAMAGSVISMAALLTVDFPSTDPLIENLIGVGCATVISGPGGVGKSHLALLLALVLGSPGVTGYLDLKVAEHVSTLLIQAENAAADTKARLEPICTYPELRNGLQHVYSLTENCSDIRILSGDFNDDHFFKRVLDDIRSTGVGLVVIDPLISFYHGDENDNSTMRRWLDRLTKLMSLTGVAIIIIHHVGRAGVSKDASYAGRGASAVGDWAHNSFLLSVHDKKTNILELSCQKARNFKKPEPILMKLNDNLVFERVEENGSVSVAFLHRLVVEAVKSQGGTIPTQKDLVDILVKKVPAFNNKTKAHAVIRDAVQAGVIVEVAAGRKKSYQVPPQQQALTPVNQPVSFTP